MEQSVKANLLAAIRHVLSPLCRIAVRNGIGFEDLTGALQSALVGAARAEMSGKGNKELTEEEVGLMTGMTSLQVRGIRGTETDENPTVNYSWAASEVLSGWHSDVSYLGPYGLVLDIPFAPESQNSIVDQRSFQSLVRKYAGPTIPADMVLEALIKAGAVQGLGNGVLRCVARTYIAERLSPENIQAFAEAVNNVIGTMAINLKRTVRGTGLLQRTVFADYGLSEEDLKRFNEFIRKTGEKFTEDVDTWFSKHSNQDRQGPIKTGIGLYHFIENDEDRERYLKTLQEGATDAL